MKKLFVAASLCLVSVSAWGHDYDVHADIADGEYVSLRLCAAALQERDAIFITDAELKDEPFDTSLSIVLLLDAKGRLRAGYYNLQTVFDSNGLNTSCGFMPIGSVQ